MRGSAVKTPGTSVKISQASAPSAAASATAVVSEPPRPRVVTSCVDVETPWKPGDEHDPVLGECLADPAGPHLDDLRLRVGPVGDDPGLRARERDGLVAEIVNRHRAERVRDPLAGRDEHVVLAWMRRGGDLVREPDQLVRRLAHRRQDADDFRARLVGGDEPLRDALQLVGVADRGAPELHHQEAGRPHGFYNGRNRLKLEHGHL